MDDLQNNYKKYKNIINEQDKIHYSFDNTLNFMKEYKKFNENLYEVCKKYKANNDFPEEDQYFPVGEKLKAIANRQIDSIKKVIESLDLIINNMNEKENIFNIENIIKSVQDNEIIYRKVTNDYNKEYNELISIFKNCEESITTYYTQKRKKKNPLNENEINLMFFKGRELEEKIKKNINNQATQQLQNFNNLLIKSFNDINNKSIIASQVLFENTNRLSLTIKANCLFLMNELNDLFMCKDYKLQTFTDNINKNIIGNNELDNEVIKEPLPLMKKNKYIIKATYNQIANDSAFIYDVGGSDKLKQGEDTILISDEEAYDIIKKMYNFNNVIKTDYIIETEEKKLEVKRLTNCVLAYGLKGKNDFKNINDITPKDYDKLKEMIKNKKEFRDAFLQRVNNFRSAGKYEMPNEAFAKICELFLIVCDFLNGDYKTVKFVCILSATFYTVNDKERNYIDSQIFNHEIFKNSETWEKLISGSIEDELVNFKNSILIVSSNLSQEEKDLRRKQLIFGQLMPFINTMLSFKVQKDMIKSLIDLFCKKYELSNDELSILNTMVDDDK